MRSLGWIGGALLCLCSHLLGQYSEYMDGGGCANIMGWTWNSTLLNSSINVDLYDSMTLLLIATATANIFRPDLQSAGYGNRYHGFSIPVPSSLKDGQVHYINVYVSGTSIQFEPLPSGQHRLSILRLGHVDHDQFHMDTKRFGEREHRRLDSRQHEWRLVHLESDSSSTPGYYEVKTTLTLAASGGTYVTYLDASSNALSGPTASGSLYAVKLQNSTFSNGACSGQASVLSANQWERESTPLFRASYYYFFTLMEPSMRNSVNLPTHTWPLLGPTAPSIPQQSSLTVDPRISHAVALIVNCQNTTDLTVGALAHTVGLSTSRFAHLFASQVGISPAQAITILVLQRAGTLLISSRLSIKEIAYRTGFTSPQQLSRAFRRYYKMSPTQYRQFVTSPCAPVFLPNGTAIYSRS